MGRVQHLFVAARRGAPMQSVMSVDAIAGQGLTGDRYLIAANRRSADYGKQFTVGKAILEGIELCEPCRLMSKRTHREVLKYFVGKGGLRARILSGGLIQVDDELAVRYPSAVVV